jgi:hypothetical protein
MTGRMTTVADCDLSAVVFPLRAPRTRAGNLMIVPISLPPTPHQSATIETGTTI